MREPRRRPSGERRGKPGPETARRIGGSFAGKGDHRIAWFRFESGAAEVASPSNAIDNPLKLFPKSGFDLVKMAADQVWTVPFVAC